MTDARDPGRRRIAVVGAGLAGTLLTWRLSRAPYRSKVDLFTGGFTDQYPGGPGKAAAPGGTAATAPDATGASGGLVRGFERHPHSATLAAASLAELLGDARLNRWAEYRETGSVYVLPSESEVPDLAGLVDSVEQWMPGGIRVETLEELRRHYPFRGLPDTAVGIVEPRGGYISPASFRDAVLACLAGSADLADLVRTPVSTVTPELTVRLADGTVREYDTVVVAVGAWTPRLLTASGLTDPGLRTKHIQYTLFPGAVPELGCFTDDISGLYGRTARNGLLLGLPSDRWGVDPDRLRIDCELAARVRLVANIRLGLDLPSTGSALVHTVAAADCYHDPAGLALRPVSEVAGLFSFTGGSGGAAKTALAASRIAATALTGSRVPALTA